MWMTEEEWLMIDLFSGLGGASQAMEEDENWRVITIDNQEKFNPDICKDILDVEPQDITTKKPDLVWSSPPCDRFTVASIGKYWDKQDNIYLPKNEEVIERIELVYHSLYLIEKLEPDYWFLENPRAMLRKVLGEPKGTITLCQFGEDRMKPTDLWGSHPEGFEYRSCSNGADCHESAPRGSRTGTQGVKSSAERAKMPYELSKYIKKQIEGEVNVGQKKMGGSK